MLVVCGVVVGACIATSIVHMMIEQKKI
jgi:hypothetical protein